MMKKKRKRVFGFSSLCLLLFSFVLSPSTDARRKRYHDPNFTPMVAVHADPTFAPLVGKIQTHQVNERRESLYDIAKKFDVAYPAVLRANRMGRWRLKEGQKLIMPTERILPGKIEDGLILNLPELSVYFFDKGEFVGFFPISVGMGGRFASPIGKRKILEKVIWKTWYPPPWAHMDHPIPGGPGNPLGKYWMGLGEGYGVHSTNNPYSIGKVVSHGCIRMYPWHAEKVYQQARVGMEVNFVYMPLKFGYKNGIIYMESHPDIYYRGTHREEYVKKILEERGLLGAVNLEQINRILSENRGIPEPVVGSSLNVTVNGKKVKFTIRPQRTKDDVIVELGPVLEAAGTDLVYSETKESATLSRFGQIYEFDKATKNLYINGSLFEENLPVFNIMDRFFVPLKLLNQLIGTKSRFNTAAKTIEIK